MANELNIQKVEILSSLDNSVNLLAESDGVWKRVDPRTSFVSKQDAKFENSMSMGLAEGSEVGEGSVALGKNVQAFNNESAVFGSDNIVGQKGFYIKAICFDTGEIVLSDVQVTDAPPVTLIKNKNSVKKLEPGFYSEEGTFVPWGSIDTMTSEKLPTTGTLDTSVIIGPNLSLQYGSEMLHKIVIPEGITSIQGEPNNTDDAMNVHVVIIPSTVTTIDGTSFNGCAISEIVIPKSIDTSGINFTDWNYHGSITVYYEGSGNIGGNTMYIQVLPYSEASLELLGLEESSEYIIKGTSDGAYLEDFIDSEISVKGIYEEGDEVNIIVPNDHYILCGTITNVDTESPIVTVKDLTFNSLLTLEELQARWESMELEWTTFAEAIGGDDYTLAVPRKPTVGIATITRCGFASGVENIAAGGFSRADGAQNLAAGNFAYVEGQKNIAGYSAHAEGNKTKALGKDSHSEGNTTIAKGAASHAEGATTKSAGEGSHAEGYKSESIGAYSHAEGFVTFARGDHSHSEGNSSEAIGNQSHVEGKSNFAYATASHVEGELNNAYGEDSHVEGKGSVTGKQGENMGFAAHAEGRGTLAYGDYSHSEGKSTQANGNASHAEGNGTIASGISSHAEGHNTQALVDYTHSEGINTNAEGSAAHTEGWHSHALGQASHAEGEYTEATGEASHAEGHYTVAGYFAHAEGEHAKATGKGSHAEGNLTEATGEYSHAQGHTTKATGNYSNAEGNGTNAIGEASHAEGMGTKAEQAYTHAEGLNTRACKPRAHAEGRNTIAGNPDADTGYSAHAEGDNTKAYGSYSHSEGYNTQALAINSHAEGNGTKASGEASHAQNTGCEARGTMSHAEGNYTIATSKGQHVQGRYNAYDDTESATGYGKYAHIVGNGDSVNKSNAHTLDWSGNAWYKGSVTSNGADYAEYFEWLDGNQDNEDRVGLLVTLDGEKIKLANDGDEILGIISATAAILGDNYECEWNGKYLTDDFGRIIYEDVEEFEEVFVGKDEEGNPIVEKQSLGFCKRPKLNPNYNPEQEYTNRANRKEWATVGMLGKLYLKDDGTCEVNKYVKVGTNGIATASTEKTNIRVLSRVNNNVIRVLLK